MVYIFNGITKFTANWFDVKTRALATAVILCSATLGNYTPIWIKMIYDADQQRLMAGVLTQGGEVPIVDPSIAFYKMMDTYKLVLFLMNLVLTFVIIYAFDSKPEPYPSLSQKYYRSKMYEPHLDVKYLLKYKEFKLYAIVCGLLFTAVNVVPSTNYTFMFVEAQSS